MLPIGRPTTLEERLAIVEGWKAGESDREIATALGLSRWTVRKWRRRYQRGGRSGLASSMGRPKTGALGSFPESIRQAIESMRKAAFGVSQPALSFPFPGWKAAPGGFSPKLSIPSAPIAQIGRLRCSTCSGSTPTWRKGVGSGKPRARGNSNWEVTATMPVILSPIRLWRSPSSPKHGSSCVRRKTANRAFAFRPWV